MRGIESNFSIHSNKPPQTRKYERKFGKGSFERHVIGIKNLCLAGLLGLNTKSGRNKFGNLIVEFSYYWTGLGNDVLLEMDLINDVEHKSRRNLLPDFFAG